MHVLLTKQLRRREIPGSDLGSLPMDTLPRIPDGKHRHITMDLSAIFLDLTSLDTIFHLRSFLDFSPLDNGMPANGIY